MSLKNLSVKIKIPKILNDHLKNKRVNQIYKKFEKNLNISENFGVGVSGGPDSLSLAFLSKVYSIKNRIEAKFFIVDHRIRKESTVEAKLVQKILNT
jgi:tRNA(Ile)-lysidine synthase